MQSLRRDRVLRIFKLNTGQDDHAVMFMDDYLNQVGFSWLPGIKLIFFLHREYLKICT